MNKKWILFLFSILMLLFAVMIVFQFVWAKKAESLYDAKDFTWALSYFETKKTFSNLHNAGNSSFRLWQTAGEKEMSLLENALGYYSGALQKEENIDTRYNYELIKKLLTEQKNKEEQKKKEQEEKKKEEEKKSQSWSGQSDTQSQSASGSTASGSQSEMQQNWEKQDDTSNQSMIQNWRDEQYKLNENQQINELTPEEKQALEQTINQLKQEQQENQAYFGKQQENSDFQKAFDSMMWGWNEKDW